MKTVVFSKFGLSAALTIILLFIPTKGANDLVLQALEFAGETEIVYQGEVLLAQDSPQGLYGITVKAAQGSLEALGKKGSGHHSPISDIVDFGHGTHLLA